MQVYFAPSRTGLRDSNSYHAYRRSYDSWDLASHIGVRIAYYDLSTIHITMPFRRIEARHMAIVVTLFAGNSPVACGRGAGC
jgi:hypothetical protein